MPQVSSIVKATHAQILRACLIDLDLVSFPQEQGQNGAWWCYVGSFADTPNEAVCVKYAPGRLFGRRARDLKQLIHPGVLILIRASKHDVAWTKAQEIADALDTDFTPRLTIKLPEAEDPDQTEHFIQNVIRTTPIIYVGEEVGKQREIFSINARIAFCDNEPSLG